tara:strand:+ start:87 stop:284 length:198 start_codon:yes stop_codon:yes gene_type:complete
VETANTILKKKMSLGEAIKEMKTLSTGIDEFHIVNPTTSVVSRLTTLVRIVKSIEVPTLIGNMTD